MIYASLKGRIGNNLFQIAAGCSLAIRNNTTFKAYIPDFILPEPDNCTLKLYLEQFRGNILRNIEFTEILPPDLPKYSEPEELSFNEIPFKKDLLIEGYFQSERFFDAEHIRKLYSIDEKTIDYIEKSYGDILRLGATSINVRRGDFVKQPHLHPVCSIEYYYSAIKHFKKDQVFLIISDDIKWCRGHFRGKNFYFIDEEPPAIDLYLQVSCKNNIISNSTFSWWGAWLNPNPGKVVIAPAGNWLGKMHPFKVSEDLLPGTWIKYPNPTALKTNINILFHVIAGKLSAVKRAIKGK